MPCFCRYRFASTHARVCAIWGRLVVPISAAYTLLSLTSPALRSVRVTHSDYRCATLRVFAHTVHTIIINPHSFVAFHRRCLSHNHSFSHFSSSSHHCCIFSSHCRFTLPTSFFFTSLLYELRRCLRLGSWLGRLIGFRSSVIDWSMSFGCTLGLRLSVARMSLTIRKM